MAAVRVAGEAILSYGIKLREAAFRVTIEPSPSNGLQKVSQVMVDTLSTLPRSRIGERFGRSDDERMRAVSRALLLVVGVI